MTPIRVLLVDDVEAYRSGVRALLGEVPDLSIVAEAADGREAVRRALLERPDVALVDLQLPNLDGVEVTRRLRIELPSCRIVILTTFDDDDRLFGALRAGASGYLTKDVSAPRLIEAVRAAARGESVLASRVVGKVIAEFARLPARESARTVDLSPREAEVLTLLARGAVNKEIGATLGITEGTVKNHLTSLFAKLGVTHRTQAALRARELGLL
jgi:DNA-binding NarL/FixJ family response regulator